MVNKYSKGAAGMTLGEMQKKPKKRKTNKRKGKKTKVKKINY